MQGYDFEVDPNAMPAPIAAGNTISIRGLAEGVGDTIRDSNMRLSSRLSGPLDTRASDYSTAPTIEYTDPRLKYYQHLRNQHKRQLKGKETKNFLDLPINIMNESEFITVIPGDTNKETGKHGSLTNIFSCWNGMVGTGLVTIPWAYSESGLLLGVALTIGAFVISFTT